MMIEPQTQGSSRGRMLLLVIVLIILAVGVGAGVYFLKNKKVADDEKKPLEQKPRQAITAVELPKEQTPPGIPADFPAEKDAKIEQNYKSPPGQNPQSTRVFVTSRTLAENLQTYQEYFIKNKWEIKNVLDEKQFKLISASKNGVTIDVMISENTQTFIRTVNITAYPPKE